MLTTSVPSFETLLFEALRSVILEGGVITAEKTEWIRQFLFADGKIDPAEKHWLRELKKMADRVSPEFEALFQQCMAS